MYKFSSSSVFQVSVFAYRALSHLFYLADLSGNAAWLKTFLREERGEEGEWDEWEGGGRTKKKGTHVSSSPPFVP
jgi:hypothetical protein